MTRIAKHNPRHEKLLIFIKNYIAANYYPPSRREMADHLNTSTSVIDFYLGQLEAIGVIEIYRKISRGIRIVANARESIIIYRCPECNIHSLISGKCTIHHNVELLPIRYMGV